MPTTARRDYDTQAWRDLHWLLNSPSLVEELAGYGAAEFTPTQAAAIHHWLKQEAREPRLLTNDFATTYRRLGLYAESLLRLALEHSAQTELLLQHFPLQEDLACASDSQQSTDHADNQLKQVGCKPAHEEISTEPQHDKQHKAKHKNKGKRTIGELDYVWRDTLSGEVHHWELAVKLYLYIPPNFPPERPIQLLPSKSSRVELSKTELSATQASPVELSEIILSGSGTSDFQVSIEAASILTPLDRFVGTQRIDTLYRKLNHLQERQLPLAQHPQVRATLQQEIHQSAYYIKGWLFYPLRPQHAEDWSSYYLPESQVSALLNPHHLRGWWLLQDEFEQHLAQQEQANQPWRWKILPRLQWLSPHRCAYAETLTGTKLWETIQENWTFFKEKEETPQPQLVVALQEDKQTSGQWHEVHRGFVVPSEW